MTTKKADKKIIAVVGMAGSGKSEVINYLQEKFGWPKIYFGKYTFERMQREGLEVNYANEKLVREKTRAELGMGAYAKLALPDLKKLLKNNQTVLIESLYSWDEYKIIREAYPNIFKVISVYASPDTRFARLQKRVKERPIKLHKEFVNRDWTEIEGTDKGGPIAIADYLIDNNQNNFKKLYQQTDAIAKDILA
ncbi:MAG: Dephospho-CoA kinase [Candidatus Falkowbacteria bacterium GW2011_GWF2_39_8]|uniref:Dephospho-CoA kinase n=1 Tax=Candidatus Falkowbacteria bacterium GW2011_GWF2_39_8 TaxID=1618642 RepID=A0A0G0T6T9_9BACT|nr:MAG: Dephospho-CoA kinase [Candidatus Falkowbacteria bacterium GW2011_GWF2_39_8]